MATKAELYAEAQALEIEGRSEMTKAELEAALDAAEEVDAVVEEEAVETVEEQLDEPETTEESEATEEPVAVDPFAPAPVISQEPTTQGGLTFITDRAQ